MSTELNMDAERAAFDMLLAAAHAVVNDGLDEAEGRVHPCDVNNDDVKAQHMPAPLQALYHAVNAVRRTAPVSSPIGEELPALPKLTRWTFDRGMTSEVAADGQWVLFKDLAPYAARIRQLERELAERKTASIDSTQFRKLLDELIDAAELNVGAYHYARATLIAYIDGRTAGAAPADVETAPAVEAPRSREWQPVTRPGQVRKGDKLRFKIGDKRYDERAKLILHPGTDKEEVIYDKGRNFYFITAMVMSGFSNHKCVEVLAAAPTPMNSGKEEGK